MTGSKNASVGTIRVRIRGESKLGLLRSEKSKERPSVVGTDVGIVVEFVVGC
jgi:hypothetical protein